MKYGTEMRYKCDNIFCKIYYFGANNYKHGAFLKLSGYTINLIDHETV